MSLQYEGVDEATERTERRCEVDVIGHSGPGGGFLKDVLVSPVPEGPSLHLVGKGPGAFVLDDLRGHPPADTELANAPGNAFTESHLSVSDTANDAHPWGDREVNPDIE